MTHAAPDDESAATPGFADRLREGTKLVHREAERAGFIADLIRGRATRRGYAIYLRNLAPAYAALETALIGSRDDVLLSAFAAPGLARLPSLEQDLDVLECGWRTALPLVDATGAYVSAIEAVAGDARLVAHAYARYLGDLSGGQILKPLLRRSLGLGADALSFYDFPGLGDLSVPKTAMRDALDRVPPEAAEPIIAEAVAAFRHNIALSEAVQAIAA